MEAIHILSIHRLAAHSLCIGQCAILTRPMRISCEPAVVPSSVSLNVELEQKGHRDVLAPFSRLYLRNTCWHTPRQGTSYTQGKTAAWLYFGHHVQGLLHIRGLHDIITAARHLRMAFGTTAQHSPCLTLVLFNVHLATAPYTEHLEQESQMQAIATAQQQHHTTFKAGNTFSYNT